MSALADLAQSLNNAASVAKSPHSDQSPKIVLGEGATFLEALTSASSKAKPGKHVTDAGITPPVPVSLDDTGIAAASIEQLVVKYLYFRGDLLGRDIAVLLGMQFSLIDDLLESLKRNHVVGVRKSLGMGNSSGVFFLTDAGGATAREYLENNQYAGPVPVPLYQYVEVVKRQKLTNNWLNPISLEQAFSHLVVESDIMEKIGPAVNSNKSFLIYGQPGNGKTALAEALFRVDTASIYMPYAIECQGNIIQVYDPIYHQKIEEAEPSILSMSEELGYDRRWFKCKRPFIVTGGELKLEMLELSYNSVSKIYDAPFQVKANNGIYLIDDFGRQKASPAEILNRWIVPMEKHVDYLNFMAGGKMTVPFEAFLIFSTNLNPHQLGDEAFLRRIQYKMFLRSPNRAEFILIFERFATSMQLQCPPGLADEFLKRHYEPNGKKMRRCHPRDLISHAIDVMNFENLPKELNQDVLDQAFSSCFVDNVDVND
ncbi:MAG: ATP-binding protein [Acidobacteriota bacterium]